MWLVTILIFFFCFKRQINTIKELRKENDQLTLKLKDFSKAIEIEGLERKLYYHPFLHLIQSYKDYIRHQCKNQNSLEKLELLKQQIMCVENFLKNPQKGTLSRRSNNHNRFKLVKKSKNKEFRGDHFTGGWGQDVFTGSDFYM